MNKRFAIAGAVTIALGLIGLPGGEAATSAVLPAPTRATTAFQMTVGPHGTDHRGAIVDRHLEAAPMRDIADHGPSTARRLALAEAGAARLAPAPVALSQAETEGERIFPGGVRMVDDFNADGIGDVATSSFGSASAQLRILSGADGEELWSRPTNGWYSTVARTSGGEPGVLLMSWRSSGTSGPLRTDATDTFVVEALDRFGELRWTSEVSGTYKEGPVRSSFTDLAYVQELADVRGDAAADLVITLESKDPTPLLPGRAAARRSTLAVFDGQDGTLHRGGTTSSPGDLHRWVDAFADLDGDGKRDLLDMVSVDGSARLARLDAALATLWQHESSMASVYVAEAADLDGDGVADLPAVANEVTCSPLRCSYEHASYALSGATGTVLIDLADGLPWVLGDVAGDARVELAVLEETHDDISGDFGFRLRVADITASEAYLFERVVSQPEGSDWFGVTLALVGDVDGDDIVDLRWHLWHYDMDSEEYGNDQGRLSLRSGARLAVDQVAGGPLHTSLDGAGDDNIDGRGTWNDAGRVDWELEGIDGLSGTKLWDTAFDLPDVEFVLGRSGDGDGDGRADLLVEAWDFDWDGGTPPEVAAIVLLNGSTGQVRWLREWS